MGSPEDKPDAILLVGVEDPRRAKSMLLLDNWLSGVVAAPGTRH